MPGAREVFVEQSPQYLSLGEARAYKIDFVDTGTPSDAGTVSAYDSTGGDAAATLSGANSISGAEITMKLFTPASVQTYRLKLAVTISGNPVIALLDVICFSPVPAPDITNGYCSLDELKREIAPVESTEPIDDIVLVQEIETASRGIDNVTGRTFYARTETRYFSVPRGRTIILDDDLLTVTTVTNGDATVIAAAQYFLEPRNISPKFAITLKQSSSLYWSWDSDGNDEYVIAIAGSWGYSSTTPATIKKACKQWAAYMDRRRRGENVSSVAMVTPAGAIIPAEGMPKDVWDLIRPYRKII